MRAVLEDRKNVEGPAREARQRREDARALLRVVTTKNRTSFIGALAKFEEAFGHLWGHGKGTPSCSPAELAWREVWEGCRNAVLNAGNDAIRAVEKEFSQYKVEWEIFSKVLPAADPPR